MEKKMNSENMNNSYSRKLLMETISEGNSSEYHYEKARRHKYQKEKIFWLWKIEKPIIALPCHVILTRISPRKLDEGDNLPYSLKWIRDAVSECLTGNFKPGRSDNDERISWEYKQEKGDVREYAIKIEIRNSCNQV